MRLNLELYQDLNAPKYNAHSFEYHNIGIPLLFLLVNELNYFIVLNLFILELDKPNFLFYSNKYLIVFKKGVYYSKVNT